MLLHVVGSSKLCPADRARTVEPRAVTRLVGPLAVRGPDVPVYLLFACLGLVAGLARAFIGKVVLRHVFACPPRQPL